MKILIKNGRLIDPANNLDQIADLLIVDEKISRIEKNIHEPDARIIDATGFWVTPGFIDLHVHFRDPGYTEKETLTTGARSARAGGFTTVCCMPNTLPVTDNPAIVTDIKTRAEKDGLVNLLPVGSITIGQKGKTLSDLNGMYSAGVCGFSEDGKTVADAFLLKQAMLFAADKNIPILSHCEDLPLVNGGVMNEGPTARRLDLPGISNESEEIIIARDIFLAKKTGARLHICHVSTAYGAQLIRKAKARGEKVSGEVCPHHFALTDDLIDGSDTNYKMNPPLRSREDAAALKQALADGTIEVIATDHAPHTKQDKSGGFRLAQNGIVGLETALPLCVTHLVHTGLLTPIKLIEKLTINPAQILGIDKGTLTPGSDADVTVVDPNADNIIDPRKFQSKSNNSPFGGQTLKGKVMYCFYMGRENVRWIT